MKIAQIDINYGAGSTGKLVSDLTKHFDRLGHSTLACFGRGAETSDKNVIKISSDVEVYLHAFLTRVTGMTGCFSPFSTRTLISKIKQFQPDIIHFHDLNGYYINISEITNYIKYCNIPTVWTLHSEFMYTGKCGHAFDCNKWTQVCHSCPQVRVYPKSYFFDFTTKMFKSKTKIFKDYYRLRVVSPSKWLGERISRSPILAHTKQSVIPNCLDTEIFKWRSNAILKCEMGYTSDFIVLSVGSNLFSNGKGGDWILKIAERLPDFKFILVGSKKKMLTHLPNVKIIQEISNQHLLSQYYAMADVLLLTSERETFSMVCAESLACGTPVIGFKAGAPQEVAPEGYGLFVEYGDINQLETKLLELKSGSLKFRSAEECSSFAHSNYCADVVATKYLDLYGEILDG